MHAISVWQSRPMGEHKFVPLEASGERILRGLAAQAFSPKALMHAPGLVQRDVMADLEYAREFRQQTRMEWRQPSLPAVGTTLFVDRETLSESESESPSVRRLQREAAEIVVYPVGGGPLPADLRKEDLHRVYAEARYPRCPAPEALLLTQRFCQYLQEHPEEVQRPDRLGINPNLRRWTVEEARREWYQFFVYSPHASPPLDVLPFDGLRRRTWHIYGEVVNGQQEISKGPGPLPISVYGENAWEIGSIRAMGFWDLVLMLEIEWAGWEGPLSATWVPCSALIPYCQAQLASFLADNVGSPGFDVPNLFAPQLERLQPHWAANVVCWPKGTGSSLVGSHEACYFSAADPWGQAFVDHRGTQPRHSYRPRTQVYR